MGVLRATEISFRTRNVAGRSGARAGGANSDAARGTTVCDRRSYYVWHCLTGESYKHSAPEPLAYDRTCRTAAQTRFYALDGLRRPAAESQADQRPISGTSGKWPSGRLVTERRAISAANL